MHAFIKNRSDSKAWRAALRRANKGGDRTAARKEIGSILAESAEKHVAPRLSLKGWEE